MSHQVGFSPLVVGHQLISGSHVRKIAGKHWLLFAGGLPILLGPHIFPVFHLPLSQSKTMKYSWWLWSNSFLIIKSMLNWQFANWKTTKVYAIFRSYIGLREGTSLFCSAFFFPRLLRVSFLSMVKPLKPYFIQRVSGKRGWSAHQHPVFSTGILAYLPWKIPMIYSRHKQICPVISHESQVGCWGDQTGIPHIESDWAIKLGPTQTGILR